MQRNGYIPRSCRNRNLSSSHSGILRSAKSADTKARPEVGPAQVRAAAEKLHRENPRLNCRFTKTRSAALMPGQIAVFRRTRYNAGFIPPDSPRFRNMPRYNPAAIEPKWQHYWETNRTFAAPRLPKGPKMYVLDMFPYPSGAGLHVGHPEGYTATDIVCRYRRNRGYSVMHPMGWDAFGLPAEQHAKKTGTHPRTTTESNINNFPPPVEDAGLQLRLGPRAGHHRRGLLPLDAIHLPRALRHLVRRRAEERPADRRTADPRRSRRARARGRRPLSRRASPGLPDRGPGQLVPGLGHGAGQRGGDRRPERTRRPSRGADAAAAMDAADHRLRRPAGKGPRRARLVGEHQDAAAELDRAEHRRGGRFLHRHGRGAGSGEPWQRGVRRLAARPRTGRLSEQARRAGAADLHHAARHALRRHLHGHRAGASVRRAADHAGAGRGRAGLLRKGRAQERPRPHRPGQGQDGRVHRLLCDQSRHRAADSHLGRRLRADQLRHRGDHGRARAR